jgi:hypothetical protein
MRRNRINHRTRLGDPDIAVGNGGRLAERMHLLQFRRRSRVSGLR